MTDILIVEDHPIVAEGLQNLIMSKGFVSQCITVYSCTECHKILKYFHPDLILLDYHLPDGNGIDLCKYIKKEDEKIKIMVISSYKEHSIIKLLCDSGASGYVLKNASEEEIFEAITSVLAGKKYLCDETRQIIDQQSSQNVITDRELDVLKLIADGFTNTEIAEKLFISPLTVDRHRKNIIIKLNAKNTASLVNIAKCKGYI